MSEQDASSGTKQGQGGGGSPADQVMGFVAERMRSGKDKGVIVAELTAGGTDKSEASRRVEDAWRKIVLQLQREEATPGAIQKGVLGGLAAAIVGGAVWGLLAIYSGYEIGIAAWGMGFLAGYGVVLLSGGRKGLPLQVVAGVSSLLGILVGKYVMFYHYFQQGVIETYGPEVADSLSVFSTDVVNAFIESLPEMVGGYDIIWVVLAAVTAWKIPKGLGIKLPQQHRLPYVME